MLEPRLRSFSRLNDWVGEKILLSPTRLAREYPVAARTAPAQFPAYSITPNRTGSFPAAAGRMGARGGRAGAETDPAYPGDAGGAAAADLHGEASLRGGVDRGRHVDRRPGVGRRGPGASRPPAARYLRFDSFDSRYYNGWDLASAMHPQTILAYAFNDRPLMADHGAPLRLYSPIKLGYKLTKYLTAMTFTRERPGGYWEDQGYPGWAASEAASSTAPYSGDSASTDTSAAPSGR